LEVVDVLYKTDICEVVRCVHRETREAFLMKTWGLERVAKAKRQMRVMKEHNIQIGLLPAPPFIPSVVKTLKDSVSLSLVMHTCVVSTLERVLDVRPQSNPNLLSMYASLPAWCLRWASRLTFTPSCVCAQEPMREEAAAFYAASVILALEHLHNENVVYRSWNLDSILIDDDGHLTFPDFQFAKQLEGPTYTLCGSPEFLAPEMVENQVSQRHELPSDCLQGRATWLMDSPWWWVRRAIRKRWTSGRWAC
jgi:serine/threonine protein kinase